ncbi:MAG: hypothetical protein ABIO70_12655 [Pseudomonadota bacterium]
MLYALLAIVVLATLSTLLVWATWREHDRLILLAYRAEQGPEAARQAFEGRLNRPGRRPLARWMGLAPR